MSNWITPVHMQYLHSSLGAPQPNVLNELSPFALQKNKFTLGQTFTSNYRNSWPVNQKSSNGSWKQQLYACDIRVITV